MFKEYNLPEKGLFVSALLMMLTLIIRDQLIPPFILLFFAASIPFWKGPKRFKEKKILYPLIGLFILYGLSILFVSRSVFAIPFLTTKLSFLLFPLVGILMTNGYSIALKGLKWGLIAGSAFSMVFALVRAIIIEKGISGNAFHANVYGLNMHPSYLALIFLISCALLWSEKSTLKSILIAKWTYLVVMIISLFYLRSLGAFVCVAAIFVAFPIWKSLQSKNWMWLLTFPVFALIFFVGLKSSARISNDVNASIEKVSEWSSSPNEYVKNNVNIVESNTVRLVVWTISAKMIIDNPFGVGLGSEIDLLTREYDKNGYSSYLERRLNPHNQFLQTGISIGWVGMILLFILFISMLLKTFRIKSLALFIAVLCIFVSCLFESMLERQVGVIILSVTMLLLLFTSLENQKNTET